MLSQQQQNISSSKRSQEQKEKDKQYQKKNVFKEQSIKVAVSDNMQTRLAL